MNNLRLVLSAVAIGLLAGVLLDVGTFLAARYGPEADGWSLRGNGALSVPFGLGPAILAGFWAGLVFRFRGFGRWLALGLVAVDQRRRARAVQLRWSRRIERHDVPHPRLDGAGSDPGRCCTGPERASGAAGAGRPRWCRDPHHCGPGRRFLRRVAGARAGFLGPWLDCQRASEPIGLAALGTYDVHDGVDQREV